MNKQPTIAQCPYSVVAAQNIWIEGFKAGVEALKQRHKGKIQATSMGKDVVIEFPTKSNDLDAMREKK